MISIIVPVYNVQHYLHRCVDSILNQTFTDFELILVDDGSPDQSGDICDIYAKIDKRVKVIHKTNGGLSDARNVGLKNTVGEYIAFIDSDDWVSPDFLNLLHTTMQKTNSDIVECDFIKVYDDYENSNVNNHIQFKTYNTSTALKLLITDSIFHQIACDKLIKKEIISGIFFEANKLNEDEFWTYQIFGKAKRITKLESVLYYYYQRPGSIMGASYSLKRLDSLEAKELRQSYIEQHFPELIDVAGTNLIGSAIYAGQMSLINLNKDEQVIAFDKLNLIIKKYFHPLKYHFIGKFKHTIWYYMARYNIKLVCCIRNRLRINL